MAFTDKKSVQQLNTTTVGFQKLFTSYMTIPSIGDHTTIAGQSFSVTDP